MSTASAYPEGMAATAPPEARGVDRDGVRLLVARPSGTTSATFRDLGRFLHPGDLLVVNTSRTLPAAVEGVREDGRRTIVHFSSALDDGSWVVEMRLPDNSGPMLDGRAPGTVDLSGGGRIVIDSPYRGVEGRSRLLKVQPVFELTVADYLQRFGRPIAYGYLEEPRPLDDYQTIFASEPGSAEMPSAGRPFSERLVARLVSKGVLFAPVVLHTGVSSPEGAEPPAAERFRVPKSTAVLVNQSL